MKNIRNFDAYLDAIERNKEIKQWCKEKQFSSFEDAFECMKVEKPDWYEALNKSIQSRLVVERHFLSIEKEKDLIRKRAVARNGQPNTRKAKAVICLDNGMKFKSINQAAKWLNHKRTHDISDCCYGIIDSVKGYRFKFIDE